MRQATDEDRQAVWEFLLLHSTHGAAQYGEFEWVANHFGLHAKAVSRIWYRGIRSIGGRNAAVVKSRATERGRKKVDRAALCQRIHEEPVADRKTQLTLQLATNTSCYLIQQLIKEGYLRRALKQTRPLLTEKHKIARMQFCADHVRQHANWGHYFDPLLDVVHIDEKWFFIKKVGQKVYILTGKDDAPEEEPPVQYVRSKRHLLKVMFLCAVARPRGDWDGKVGMCPIVEEYITQRASVNRGAGVVELRPISMTRGIARRMLVEDVIPAIKSKWPRGEMHRPIKIQQDNARPHVDAKDPRVLATGLCDGWNISLTNQPAQSPELNALDVGFFCSIQALQSQMAPRNIKELIGEVELAFEDTSATTLNKTFLTLQLIMENVMRRRGGNDFRLTHFKKDSLVRAGRLPTELPCEFQLYYDTLAAVVPQTPAHPPPDLDYLA